MASIAGIPFSCLVKLSHYSCSSTPPPSCVQWGGVSSAACPGETQLPVAVWRIITNCRFISKQWACDSPWRTLNLAMASVGADGAQTQASQHVASGSPSAAAETFSQASHAQDTPHSGTEGHVSSPALQEYSAADVAPARPQASFQTGALGEAPPHVMHGLMPHPSAAAMLAPPQIGPKAFPSAVVPGSVKLFVGQVRVLGGWLAAITPARCLHAMHLSSTVQIPRTMNEPALRPVFEEMGEILELAIIRDRNSHLHRGMCPSVMWAPQLLLNTMYAGCAFLTYRTAEAAEAAIEKFHDKITFPPVRGCHACRRR